MIFFNRRRRPDLREELNSKIEKLNERLHQLEDEYSKAQAILSSMAEGVIAVDKDTKVLSINPSVEKIFGVSKDETEGKLFLEVIRNNDISEVISDVLKNANFLSKELSLVWPVQKTFQINATPIFSENAISGCLVVIHDVTEIRRLEKMRSDFVANVSHELRTPLTAIKGFVETLLGGALEDKEHNRRFLEIIQEHAERLNNLINDLLDLSSVESKQLELEIEEFSLAELTQKVLSGFRGQLNKKNIEARNDLSKGELIKADKVRIEQVLTNLIDNAIKFNKENGIVKIYSRESTGIMEVIVEDSGVGIPQKDILRIFERFYRVDKARSRELGGTGLGLSIIKHIVELHGGSVGVESTEGLGSKFWFAIPR